LETSYRVLRHNIRANLHNGIAGSIGINMIIPFVGVMAAKIGATNTDFALLSSIPALLTLIVTLPAALVIEQFKLQKKIAGGILFISRLCYLLMGFIPLLPFGRMQTLIFFLGVYTAATSVATVTYQAILGEIIPVKYRNRLIAQRNIWSGLFGMVVVVAAGWSIDRITFPLGYQIAFGIGFVASLFEVFYFLRFRIPSEELESLLEKQAVRKPRQTLSSLSKLWQINAGRPFYLYCGCTAVYLFAWQAVWPVYLKIKVDILQATNFWISIDTVSGVLGTLVGFHFFAVFADRKGNAITIFISALGLGVTPLLWIYAPSMLMITVYDFVGGIVTAGFTQSMLNRLLEIVPSDSRQRAIAMFTSLSQVSAIIAPLVGIRVYELLPYWLTMTTAGAVRIIAAFFFLLIISPGFIKHFSPKGMDLRK
jgi:MFS family permease